MKEITLGETKLKCYENGTIERLDKRSNLWKFCKGNKKGYMKICIENKMYLWHRIIAFAFGLINLETHLQIDHYR